MGKQEMEDIYSNLDDLTTVRKYIPLDPDGKPISCIPPIFGGYWRGEKLISKEEFEKTLKEFEKYKRRERQRRESGRE